MGGFFEGLFTARRYIGLSVSAKALNCFNRSSFWVESGVLGVGEKDKPFISKLISCSCRGTELRLCTVRLVLSEGGGPILKKAAEEWEDVSLLVVMYLSNI